MSGSDSVAPRFNEASAHPSRSGEVQSRVDEAMRRMEKSFERNEPHLVVARYGELLSKQGIEPHLKPSYAADDAADRLRKIAKYQVKYEHHGRLNKIKTVADRMSGKNRNDLEI